MHNHDQDLIMALAEGTLDPAAATAARVEIGACPDCTLELEMQTAGLGALQQLPAAGLSELETARLMRNLRTELGIAPEKPHRQPVRRRMPLAALGTAAAVLLAVVVVAGPGLNLIGGADSEDATADFSAASTTEAAQSTTAAPAEALAPEAGMDAADGDDRFADAPVPATTAAPATTTTAAMAGSVTEGTDLFAYYASRPNLDTLLDTVTDAGYDDAVARAFTLRTADDSVLEESLDDAAACIEVTLSGDDDFIEGFQLARGDYDGREAIIIVYLAEYLEESAVIAHAADNCEELDRSGA